ncbi:MAG: RsmB/NOP family class I SAM-dependent RNA methyltransferase, partial [Verrucomicrobiota bacterium]
TLTRAETSGVCEAFLKAHADFEPLPFANPFKPDAPPSASYVFWPQETGGSGMFVAKWRRRTV